MIFLKISTKKFTLIKNFGNIFLFVSWKILFKTLIFVLLQMYLKIYNILMLKKVKFICFGEDFLQKRPKWCVFWEISKPFNSKKKFFFQKIISYSHSAINSASLDTQQAHNKK